MKKLLRIRVERNWPSFPNSRRHGFVLRVELGRGAGCIWGRTAFLALRSGSLRWQLEHRGYQPRLVLSWLGVEYLRLGRVEVGFTKGANLVPYADRV
jgi:hypothetical protein